MCSWILLLQGDGGQGARKENSPKSRRKAEKTRKDRMGMIQNKGQCFRGHSGFSCGTQHLGHTTFTEKQSISCHSAGRNPVHAGDCAQVPQDVLCKPWTLWQCPSCAGGSCPCANSNSCPQLEHSPGSCSAALPPGNAKSQTRQFSTVTCLPALPVIPLVIPLPLSPNKCPRQGEHPRVLNSSWSSSPPSVNFGNSSGALKSYWVSEHRAGILSAAHSASLAFLKELISTWTSQDLLHPLNQKNGVGNATTSLP